MKKKILFGSILLALLVAAVSGGYIHYLTQQRKQCGILLAFDDYSAQNWEEHFDLFDKYNVKVTFFLNASEPTEFCYKAKERGHEIAYHTMSHAKMTEISGEEVYEQAIAPIKRFREEGFDLTTFAYPYGMHNDILDDFLLKHYKVLRGAYALQINDKDKLKAGFVESLSIDNINYDSQEEFEERITKILTELKAGDARAVSLYSHAIEGGNWCVSEEKLEFLFKTAKEMGLEFYTFQELQNA